MIVVLGDTHQCECEALATHRHAYLGPFSLHKGPVKGLWAMGPKRLKPIIYSILDP